MVGSPAFIAWISVLGATLISCASTAEVALAVAPGEYIIESGPKPGGGNFYHLGRTPLVNGGGFCYTRGRTVLSFDDGTTEELKADAGEIRIFHATLGLEQCPTLIKGSFFLANESDLSRIARIHATVTRLIDGSNMQDICKSQSGFSSIVRATDLYNLRGDGNDFEMDFRIERQGVRTAHLEVHFIDGGTQLRSARCSWLE